MRFKVQYTKTVVLTSEFEVDVPEAELAKYPGEDPEEWAKEMAYEMESSGKIKWEEIENQGDPPQVTKL